jgi:hypothetical protein
MECKGYLRIFRDLLPVQSAVSASPPTVRQAWFSLFIGFMVVQGLLVLLGVFFATGGKALAADAVQKLDSMRQVFQFIAVLGVIACMVMTRTRLHPEAVRSPQDLFRSTIACLMVGEVTVLIALVGLSKLHLEQYLVAAGLVFLADFILVLPAGLRVLAQPVPTSGTGGNKEIPPVN